ncbi:MAG: insulinase family protein [Alphaproteobacteria bacterium]|nr:insulinase family protein [Alphaproteobacteria bacterium]
MLRKWFLAFFFFLSAENINAAPLLTFETFTLNNGLQFLLMKNERAPIVSYTTWFKVGSADEVPGKTGLAHYLEHLMESGMPEVQMGQFLEDFYSSGTHSNAFTSYDVTYYYKMVMAENLELLMRYEAGRMRGMAFNKDKFETERNVILEERLMRTENEPIALFNEKFNSQFFTVHPYKNPVIGLEKDIRTLTFEDLKAFHKKWYHPNNAFIIISGDFDPSQVRKWAEKYYGDIPSGQEIKISRPQEPLEKPKIEPIFVEHPRTPETLFTQIYPLPNLKTHKFEDLLALLLLAEFLNGDFEGSLYEILIHKKKLATSFEAQCQFLHFLDPWSFAITVGFTSDPHIKEVKNLIDERLNEIEKNGLKQEDLARARKYTLNDWIISSDDIYQKAVFLGTTLSSGLTLEQITSLPEKLKQVTSADIQKVIKTYLIKEKAVVGILKKPSSLPSNSPKPERP